MQRRRRRRKGIQIVKRRAKQARSHLRSSARAQSSCQRRQYTSPKRIRAQSGTCNRRACQVESNTRSHHVESFEPLHSPSHGPAIYISSREGRTQLRIEEPIGFQTFLPQSRTLARSNDQVCGSHPSAAPSWSAEQLSQARNMWQMLENSFASAI